MYNPPAFRMDERSAIFDLIRKSRIANLVTFADGALMATPLPMFLSEDEGDNGVLYGHIARANPQWKVAPDAEALAIFMGPDAYVSPSYYLTKKEHGKVVPTWNYASVQARGRVEFFDDGARLLDVVTKLTDLHERGSREIWQVADAPEAFIEAQLRGIVGVRLAITELSGKMKMSQNRVKEDRLGVKTALAAAADQRDRDVATLIPD